jgi:hypothetical protein
MACTRRGQQGARWIQRWPNQRPSAHRAIPRACHQIGIARAHDWNADGNLSRPRRRPAPLVTGDGRPLPPRLASKITREFARLSLVQQQIAALEGERDQAPTPCKATGPHTFSPSRFPPLEIFGRRPSACVAVPQRPASENLHNLGRSTPSARIRFTPRPVDMMHDGECRIGLAARGRMDVDQFFKVPAPHDEPFQ